MLHATSIAAQGSTDPYAGTRVDFRKCPKPSGENEETRLQVITSWLSKELNGQPGPADIYELASYFYHRGWYSDSLVMLNLYKTMPGHVAKEADHLIGYAAWKLNKNHLIQPALSNSLKDKQFEDDWQLLVENGVSMCFKDPKIEEDVKCKKSTKSDVASMPSPVKL
jgi:hypothetical protein